MSNCNSWSLAGGGSRGIWQAGAIKAMCELGLDYKYLFGTSVGAINASQLHQGDIDRMVDFWLKISTREILQLGWFDTALAFRRGWLHDSKPLRKYLDKNISYEKIQANPREFWINATDYTNKRPYSRESKTLSKEDLVTMVYASASPPVYMPTVPFEGRQLVDGGVCNNFSLTQAIQFGCSNIYLVLCSNPLVGTQEPGNLVDRFSEVMGLTMNTYLEREQKCIDKVNELIDSLDTHIKPKKINLTVIAPEKELEFGFLDFDFKGLDRMKLIQDGYNTAMKVLNQ